MKIRSRRGEGFESSFTSSSSVSIVMRRAEGRPGRMEREGDSFPLPLRSLKKSEYLTARSSDASASWLLGANEEDRASIRAEKWSGLHSIQMKNDFDDSIDLKKA